MIEIRKATIDDGDFILEVRNHESTLQFLHDARTFGIKDFENCFKKTNPEWFIIEKNDKNVGYLRTKWELEKKILQVGADIHPDFRGMGYAKEAYKKLFHEYKTVEKYTLEVFSDNHIALKLYNKLGFSIVKQYNLDNRISIIMEKINE